jgi:hypothetical protein
MARRAMAVREKKLWSRVFGVLAVSALAAGIVFSIAHSIDPLPAFVLMIVWAAIAVYYATAPTKHEAKR